MPLWKLQNQFEHKSGLPKDRMVNSLYVDGPDPSGSNLTDLTNAMIAFYDAVAPGNTVKLSSYFSQELAQNGHVLKVFRMQDPQPRVPALETTWNFGAALTASALPGEVAYCLSFEAAKISGQNQARRRGRIYLGPLASSILSNGTNGEARPLAAFMSTVRNAATQFKTAVNTAGYVWVVYSPTTGATSRASVASVWTDNAFDTQRRRGVAPTAKTRVAVAQIALGA